MYWQGRLGRRDRFNFFQNIGKQHRPYFIEGVKEQNPGVNFGRIDKSIDLVDGIVMGCHVIRKRFWRQQRWNGFVRSVLCICRDYPHRSSEMVLPSLRYSAPNSTPPKHDVNVPWIPAVNPEK